MMHLVSATVFIGLIIVTRVRSSSESSPTSPGTASPPPTPSSPPAVAHNLQLPELRVRSTSLSQYDRTSKLSKQLDRDRMLDALNVFN